MERPEAAPSDSLLGSLCGMWGSFSRRNTGMWGVGVKRMTFPFVTALCSFEEVNGIPSFWMPSHMGFHE